jgi:hypothetical protein
VAPVRTVAFADSCKPPNHGALTPATYNNCTGPHGMAQRRLRPNKKRNATRSRHTHHSAVPRATHDHATRSSSTFPHRATAATTVPEPFEHFAFHGNVVNPDTGAIAEYVELSKCSEGHHWRQSNTDEIGRLAQGYGDIKGTNTMFFIPFSEIPQNKTSTYLRVVSAYRPEKENPRRVRWTVGGDQIDYPGDVSTKTADLTTSKILVNSVLSTPKALFGTGDIKYYYLGTPLPGPEFMCIPLHMIPPEIMIAYDLEKLVHKGAVYVRIDEGMYGLPQAGKLANDQLQKFLAVDGYEPMPVTPGLWRHKTRTFNYVSWWTTLESNTPTKLTPIISLPPCANTTL